MASGVVLLGPHRAGKTAVGRLLARRLGMDFLPLGEVNRRYFRELGFDEDTSDRCWRESVDAGYRYAKPFEVHALERPLSEPPGRLVELESTQSVYEDTALLARARDALRGYGRAILLLPSPDLDESVRVLEGRQRPTFDGMELNEHFIRHLSNRALAKLSAYTLGKTPEETRDEILGMLDPSQRTVVLIGPGGAGKKHHRGAAGGVPRAP